MITVRYDGDTDQIFITGEDRSYARRSLIASLEGADQIGVRLKFATPQDLKLKTPFTNLLDGDGNGFSSQAAAKAYLDQVFSLRRPEGFEFSQSDPLATWTIAHGLGFRPCVSVVDTAGDLCLADVRWPDAAVVVVSFGAPTAGTAYLS